MTAKLSRRAFAKSAAGLVVAFSLAPHFAMAQGAPAKLPGSLNNNRKLDGWLRINPDGTVTVFTGKVELGQGAVTALAQIGAEELDVAFSRIRMISGDTARTPDEGFTSGSQSMEYGGTAIQYAAAEARGILLALAAEKLGVAADSLTVEDGTIRAAGGKSATYWALSPEASLAREASAKTPPKPAQKYTVIGKSVPRLDIPKKLTGGAAYVQDVRFGGMLFGRVVRPPSYNAELVETDLEFVNKMPGVQATVRLGRFLGVVALREEQAIAARTELAKRTKWNNPVPLPPNGGMHDYLRQLPNDTSVISEKTVPGPRAFAVVFGQRYTRPYIAHASIGPSCTVAQFAGDKLTVWSHTQGVFPLRKDLAKALKLPEDNIAVAHVEGSGCYGHNGADDVALDAALLARAAGGKPVKVQWMRDDEFAWEPYGAAMTMAVRGALDNDGKVGEWEYELWSNTHSTRPGFATGVNLLAAWHLDPPMPPSPPTGIPQPAGGGDRNSIPLYDFPRQKVTHHFIPQMPLRVSALRTLGAQANVFATESFMDELAAVNGTDPVEFRLKHLTDARARAVIEAAAKSADWKKGAKGTGTRGRGIGFAKYKNLSAYVAVVAEVEVDRATGAVRVLKATAAADAGQIVNPDGLRNQIEGGIVQGTSWTLKEQIVTDVNGIASRDWASYPILTFPEVPQVEVTLIDQPGLPWLGAGEAAQGPITAAIANAVAHAAGARVRDLPLTPDRVKRALA